MKINLVADALSCVSTINSSTVTNDVLAKAETSDTELQQQVRGALCLSYRNLPCLGQKPLSTVTYPPDGPDLMCTHYIAVASSTICTTSAILVSTPPCTSWLTAMFGLPCSVTVAPGLLTEICTQCQRAKIPGTSFHHLEQSPSHCTASNTSTFTSLGLFYQPALIANASHQSIQAVRLELIDLLKVPRNFSVALFVALWFGGEKDCSTPFFCMKSRNSLEVNWLPLSATTLSGSPYLVNSVWNTDSCCWCQWHLDYFLPFWLRIDQKQKCSSLE